MVKIGIIQLDAQGDIPANLDAAETAVREAAGRGATTIALPELFDLRVGKGQGQRYPDEATPIPGLITDRFTALANELNIHLLLGSIAEKNPKNGDNPEKVYNTSCLIDPAGKVIARYRKAHLFDITIGDRVSELESKRFIPGDELVTVDTGAALGVVGLSICYDLRFGEMFRALALRGAGLVFVPSNFTHATGQDHWIAMLRARAIEFGCFIIAPNQCGHFKGGFQAYGHSAVIDPWGNVLVELDDQPGVGVCEIDLGDVAYVRAKLPGLKHRRPELYR